MTAAVLIVTLSTAAYYLAGRAKITEALWSRYPRWLEYWALCAACFGTAAGAGAGALATYHLRLPVLGIAAGAWEAVAAGAALGMVWTPVLGAAMVRGWLDLSDPGEDPE